MELLGSEKSKRELQCLPLPECPPNLSPPSNHLRSPWCARILTATAVEHEPVSRAEAEALFEINDAAAERSDDGRFDDLLAKAVVHHAASESGLPVPSRTIALSPDTAIESWAPARAAGVNSEVLDWIASQIRGKRRSNRTLMRMVATIVGAAALPFSQLPKVFDIGM